MSSTIVGCSRTFILISMKLSVHLMVGEKTLKPMLQPLCLGNLYGNCSSNNNSSKNKAQII